MRVYIETSVIGYLTAPLSRDLIIASRQELTHAWWEEAASDFELFCSNTELKEATQKDPQITQKQLEGLNRLIDIPVTQAAVDLAEYFVKAKVLPAEALPQALQIAVCVVHGIEFLTTWNHKHIANAMLQRSIEQACKDAGYNPTCICTPLTLSGEHLMRDDPIMQELWAIKAAINKEANYSVDELAKHLLKKYPSGTVGMVSAAQNQAVEKPAN
jgi:hypothetical protein